MSKDLESLYRVSSWPEDLIGGGKKRFEEAYRVFSNVIEHMWFRDFLLNKRSILILDLCGGVGVGGISLAKVLVERGFDVRVIINDLRSSALEKAKIYGREILGFDIEIVLANALDIDKYVSRADIALIYGLSLPHFDSYDLVYLIAVLSKILGSEGILAIEEIDRVWVLYSQRDKKDYFLEYSDDRYILSGHVSYNPLRGLFKRVFIDLSTMDRIYADFRLWDLASVLSTAWVFFREVDFVPIKSFYHGIILARGSRGINPSVYREKPFK
ncbi:MAG: hypothetical protein ACP5GI_07365 [Sulfolobales archaeon]